VYSQFLQHGMDLKEAARLLTPGGFISFLEAKDAPPDADKFDGITSEPFPGVWMTLRVGKSARALWNWAQQFRDNQNN